MAPKIRFYDFHPEIPFFQQGQFKSYTDPSGFNVTEVVAHEASGDIKEVRRTSGSIVESFLYTYFPNAGLLKTVTLQRSTNAGSSFTPVRTVEYAYYQANENFGNQGDLKTATIKDGDGDGEVLDTTFYRYYEPAGGGEAQGETHLLKYVFHPESFERLVAAEGSNLDNITDAEAAPFADNYFEYDSQQRATKEIAQGAGCSSCTGGQGEFTYAYYDRSVEQPQNYVAGPNSWRVRTSETLPDGNNIVYTNAAGQVMLQIFNDPDTDGTGPDIDRKWLTYYRYDADGRVVSAPIRQPSSVTTNPGMASSIPMLTSQPHRADADHLADSAGLITDYTYYTETVAASGKAKGYLEKVGIRNGETGANVPQSHQTYFERDAASHKIYLPAASTIYTDDAGENALTTTTAYSFFNGTLRVESKTTTDGSSGDATAIFYDTYGRPIWSKDAAGFINHFAYDQGTGAVVTTIVDVDTDEITGWPTTWTPTPTAST